MTIDELLADATRRMDKSIESAREHFNTVRTGRASAALLDRIKVDYYGQQTPLKQLATIGVPEPRMLTVQPFDPSSMKGIEKAIQESDLGLTPSNDGKIIRLPIPQLTEERRKESSSSSASTPRRGASRSATSAATSCTTSRSWSTTATSARTRSVAPRSARRSSPTST